MKKKITNIRDSKLTKGAASIIALILLGLSIKSNFNNPNPIETKDPEASHTIFMPDNKESELPNWISDDPTNSIYETLEPDAVDSGIITSEEPTATITDPVAIPSKIPNHWWDIPTLGPIILPSAEPSVVPSTKPSVAPSAKPSTSVAPTVKPSVAPSAKPSIRPSERPVDPTYNPGGPTKCSHWLHGDKFNENGEVYCWLCHKWVKIPGLEPSPSPSPSASVSPSAEPSPTSSLLPITTPEPTSSPTTCSHSSHSEPNKRGYAVCYGCGKTIFVGVPNPDPSASVSANPDPSASVSVDPDPSASVSANPDPSASVSVDPDPSASVSANPDPSASVSANPDPSASVSANPDPSTSVDPEPEVSDWEDWFSYANTRKRKTLSYDSIAIPSMKAVSSDVVAKIKASRKQMADLLATLETEKQIRGNYTRLRRL